MTSRKTNLTFLLLATLAVSVSAQEADQDGHDCICECCREQTCPSLVRHTFHAGSVEACTEDACSSKFYSCPDTGSHNEGTVVRASYFHDCECACCREEECPELTTQTFYAGSPEACSPASCRREFYRCPDEGSHNDGVTEVFASYSDCSCSCCTEAGNRERGPRGECTESTLHMMFVGGPAMCTPEACMSSFYNCKDGGSHNEGFDVTAAYIGNYPPPPPPSPPPSPPPFIEEVEEALKDKAPEYVVVAAVTSVLVALVMVFTGFWCYKKKQAQGYQWVKMEGHGAAVPEDGKMPTVQMSDISEA